MLACSLATDGDRDTGTRHLERARRVYQSIRSAPGLVELSRRWDEATAQRGHVVPRDATQPITHDGTAAARNVLQTVAALLRHHGRPELVAREIVHLLGETGCVVDARALSIGADGHAEILAAERAEPDRGADAPTPPQPGCRAEAAGIHRRLSIGFARERAVEVELDVRPEIESQATVHAVRLLLATVQDLERARAEREERISLWPADDDPAELGHAVVRGQMRELMSDARRIANTNVSAFITGESGTGKEILARALHNFSDRAEKPFIPFNCTAVPRDILDSQLFGHRRGSFTGAERDHAGMIGAAQGGTLFLDEIGELGLDLQPKLLRFLESSEICPIGEATPVQGQRPRRRRDELERRATGEGRPVSGRSVLPAERGPAAHSAAARTPRRDSGARRPLRGAVRRGIQERRHPRRPKTSWSTSCCIDGRATCASCKMKCGGWWHWRSRTPC